ncbi:uncharacterized protein LOC134217043 isoform X1 [Armigeres subalbatus]|uniref:uncharacterized protein LOC134217043 isoform X1 n=1 Tax=Armigeres subalbatus TaxID=124917 RepID=UPI002ED4C088
MMSSRKKLTPMLNDYLYEAIRRVAIEQGFTPELFSVDFDEETAIECDGFVYFVFKAIVNEDDREFVLWCKVPPNDDQRSLALFKREVFFFREILPAFYKFQTVKDTSREKGAGFYDMPKCYLAHCDTEKEEPEAAIILEYDENHEKWDWDKLKPIDLDHSKVLMEQLGQFHAILFAMKSQKPELFEKFTSQDALVGNDDLETLMEESFDRATPTRRTRFVAEQDTASSETNEPYCADSHSDCWIDNLIYKHNENNAATNVTLTDWHASPLLDLSYFFFICVGAQFRKDNLLQHYHNALEKLLDRLEGNTATQFPVADLLRIVQSYRRLLKDE